MADWCKVFTRYYESVDVSYQKPEDEMYKIMSQYVSDVLAREPNLMYQHFQLNYVYRHKYHMIIY